MPAMSFDEIHEANRKKVGKRWFTTAELAKATESPTPFTKSDTTKDAERTFGTFAAAVDFVMERDGVNRLKAMSTARRQYPSLIGKAQDEADEALAKAAQDEDDEETRKFARKAIARPFLAKVEHIRTRDGIGHATAMSKARREFPTEFAEAFGTD